MRGVVALGGNARLRRGEPPDTEHQRRNVAAAPTAVAQIAREHALVAKMPRSGLIVPPDSVA
jgi:carbamate kinase